DEQFPEWGDSPYFRVGLQGRCRLHELLSHLYVLVPVLDNDKHYWIGDDEVEKLLRHGEGWLASHPEQELIVRRYLRHRGALTQAALAGLAEEDVRDPDSVEEQHRRQEDALEERLSLNEQRLNAVTATLKELGAKRVLDLGCGEGRLLKRLLEAGGFDELVGMDVSYRAIEMAGWRVRPGRVPGKQRVRVPRGPGPRLEPGKRPAGERGPARGGGHR